MTIYDRIAGLCDAQNISVNALSTTLNISNGNHATWKKGNIKVEHLLKICNYLQTSADYLLGLPSADLAPDEQELIDLYRECPAADKENIVDICRTFAERETSARKKGKKSV